MTMHERVQRTDSQGMYALIQAFADHLEAGRRLAQAIDLRVEPETIQHVVAVGMGGSAIGADLVRSLAASTARVPMHVVRGYHVPAYVGPGTVVLVSSYSGNTEETLAAFEEAEARGARILAISSNGEVQARAEAAGYPLVTVPGGMPPRAALGYSFAVVLTLTERLGLIAVADDWDEALATVRAQTAELEVVDPEVEHDALELARALYDAVPLIYSGNELLDVVNVRWRGQLQENSKMLALGNVFPELNHNEIMGWTDAGAFHNRLAVVVLRDDGDDARIQQRMTVTQSLLAPHAQAWVEAWSRGPSPLARLLTAVHLGDWVSFYAAMLRGTDPTPIALINALKSALQEPAA